MLRCVDAAAYARRSCPDLKSKHRAVQCVDPISHYLRFTARTGRALSQVVAVGQAYVAAVHGLFYRWLDWHRSPLLVRATALRLRLRCFIPHRVFVSPLSMPPALTDTKRL